MKQQRLQYNFTSSSCTEQSILSQHCHMQYELIYVCTGEISLNVEGTVYTIKKNQAILLPPKTFHTIYGTDKLYERLVVTFSDEFVPKEIFNDFLAQASSTLVIQNSVSTHILKQLSRYVADKNPAFLPLADALFMQFLYGISVGDSTGNAHEPHNTNPTVEQITELINNNLDKAITIDFIAQTLFMSRSSVSHIFKDYMKTSIKQYVLNKKMTWAEELLAGGMQPCDVAKQLGYENYSAFYKMFLRIAGYPPSQSAYLKQE